MFKQQLELSKIPTIQNSEELEKAAIELQSNIINAFKAATTTKTIKNQKEGILPNNIKLLLKEKYKLRRTFHRTQNPIDKTQLNILKTQVKQALQEYRNKKWNEKVQSLQTTDQSIWRTARILKNKTSKQNCALKTNEILAITDMEKANMFAHAMSEQFQPHQISNDEDEKMKKTNQSLLQPGNESTINSVEPQEIVNIIKLLKKKRAPGHDLITNQMLKQLPKKNNRTYNCNSKWNPPIRKISRLLENSKNHYDSKTKQITKRPRFLSSNQPIIKLK